MRFSNEETDRSAGEVVLVAGEVVEDRRCADAERSFDRSAFINPISRPSRLSSKIRSESRSRSGADRVVVADLGGEFVSDERDQAAVAAGSPHGAAPIFRVPWILVAIGSDEISTSAPSVAVGARTVEAGLQDVQGRGSPPRNLGSDPTHEGRGQRHLTADGLAAWWWRLGLLHRLGGQTVKQVRNRPCRTG